MTQTATSMFEVKDWDEKPYEEIDGGAKLTRARVTKSFEGDIEGEGTIEYLMVHARDGSATFTGVERIVGRIGKRSGSLVLHHSGTFEGGTAKATCRIVAGAGTGDLESLRGEGAFEAQGRRAEFTLRYDVE